MDALRKGGTLVLGQVRRRRSIRDRMTILRDDVDEVLVVARMRCCHLLESITCVACQFASVELGIIGTRTQGEGDVLEILHGCIDQRFTASHRACPSQIVGIVRG